MRARVSVLYVNKININCVFTDIQQEIDRVQKEIEGMWLASLELNVCLSVCIYRCSEEIKERGKGHNGC